MNSVYLPNNSESSKTRVCSHFMKYLDNVVSLIFLPKTLIWNKITFPALNSLNFGKLVDNELMRNISKKITNISFPIQFIAAYWKDFKNL